MPTVTTTLGVSDVAKSLLGDLVDGEAIAKMSPDPSGVHVHGNLRPVLLKRKKPVAKKVLTPEERAKREHTERQWARAGNALGIAAGTQALYSASTSPRLRGKVGKPVGGSAPALLTRKGKLAAAGAVGTQALNTGFDVLGARVMARDAKRDQVGKGIPLPKLRAGRLKSMKATLGFGGGHSGGQSVARNTSTRAGGGQHRPGPMPGTYVNPNPRPATPGQPRGAVGSNAPGPLTPGQQSAAAAGAGARQKLEQFMGSTGGKVAMAGGAGLAVYGAGKAKGREQAYYGKRHDVEIAGTFSKFDDEKKRAYGWASVVTMDGEPVVDRQGDYIGLDDIEEAAYAYVRKSRVTGDMHRRTHDDQPHRAGELIESVVFTPDKCHAMGLPASFAGRWWMGVQVEDDEVWSEVKKGNRTGFSIHGKGLRKDTTLDEIRAGR